MSTTLEIQTLFRAQQEELGLVWITGEQHQDKQIHSSKDDSPETSLVGHLNLIIQHRLPSIGSRALEHPDSLQKNSRKDAIAQLFSGFSTLIVMANRLPAPDDLKDMAAASLIPLLSSGLPSQKTIENLQHYLASYFSEKITLHGVFMEVMGTGVLITGDSSIGKSELALELITRGHRLIADDATEFSRVTPDTLLGSCPGMLRDFLEVRGLGILDIRATPSRCHQESVA
mgnify:CR=1 FL=1